MNLSVLLSTAGVVALAAATPRLWRRLQLSRAKHRSLAGHARFSLRFARQVPYYSFRDDRFFACDGASAEVASRRQAGFARLATLYSARFSGSRALGRTASPAISDLQFTGRYRVPFPFSGLVRERLTSDLFLASSSGVTVTDVDGNTFYDLAGSYGVNLLGHDAYKGLIEAGAARVGDLGPVLGTLHPVVAGNVRRLREISGLDEVSFHMSGTEAVMQAVRLARYHTGRSRLVRFCGAYHGWWGDVQPGIGNPLPANDTFTLAEMSEKTLAVLRSRRDIACVLVNPLQALHPNSGAPSDGALVDSSRRAGFDRATYTEWLQRLRAVCTEAGIPLIFDEVFVGFRLAPGGAQEYFGVKADMVTYGKTLGGGLPVGVLCGTRELMRRYRDARPADICFARGTFNAHPYVMGAMAAFLDRLETPESRAMYAGLDQVWSGRAESLNRRLAAEKLPLRVAALSSIWTILYERPSRYNWMLQYYLRAEGLALSWVGTGRLIFSLNYTDADFAAVADRIVAAARAMEADGWWHEGLPSNRAIKNQILREMLAARFRGRTGLEHEGSPVPAAGE